MNEWSAQAGVGGEDEMVLLERVGPLLALPYSLIELDSDSDLLAGPCCSLNCIFLSIASTAGVI